MKEWQLVRRHSIFSEGMTVRPIHSTLSGGMTVICGYNTIHEEMTVSLIRVHSMKE